MDESIKQFVIENINDVNREFSRLDEHILSANLNYQHTFNLGEFNPLLKAGTYTEYRTRKYNPVISCTHGIQEVCLLLMPS